MFTLHECVCLLLSGRLYPSIYQNKLFTHVRGTKIILVYRSCTNSVRGAVFVISVPVLVYYLHRDHYLHFNLLYQVTMCENATACSLFVDIWLKLAQVTILYLKFKKRTYRLPNSCIPMVELDADVKGDKFC